MLTFRGRRLVVGLPAVKSFRQCVARHSTIDESKHAICSFLNRCRAVKNMEINAETCGGASRLDYCVLLHPRYRVLVLLRVSDHAYNVVRFWRMDDHERMLSHGEEGKKSGA